MTDEAYKDAKRHFKKKEILRRRRIHWKVRIELKKELRDATQAMKKTLLNEIDEMKTDIKCGRSDLALERARRLLKDI